MSFKKNLIFNLLTEIIINMMPFIWLSILAKKNINNLSEFIVLTTLYSYSRVLIDFGLNNIAIKDYTLRKSINLVLEVIGSKLIMLVVTVLLITISFFLLKNSSLYNLFLNFLPIVLIPLTLDWIFKAENQSIFNFFSGLMASFLSIIYIYTNSVSIESILVSKIIWTFIYTITILTFLIKKFKYSTTNSYRLENSIKYLENNKLYGISAFIIITHYNFSITVSSYLTNSEDLALYGSLVKIFMLYLMFRQVVITTFLPKIITLNKNKNKLIIYLKRMTLFLTIFYLLGFIIIYILKDEIITLLFNEKLSFNPHKNHTLILIGACGLTLSLNTFLPSILVVNEKRIEFFKSLLFGLITNICLCLTLIPLMGIIGAAIALLLAEIVIFIKTFHQTNNIIHYVQRI